MFQVIWQADKETDDFKWDCNSESTGTRTLINTVNGLAPRLNAERKRAFNEGGVNQCNKARGACPRLLFTQQETHTHSGLASHANVHLHTSRGRCPREGGGELARTGRSPS